MFSTRLDNFLQFSSNLELSSANSFSLEGSKFCRLGKGWRKKKKKKFYIIFPSGLLKKMGLCRKGLEGFITVFLELYFILLYFLFQSGESDDLKRKMALLQAELDRDKVGHFYMDHTGF